MSVRLPCPTAADAIAHGLLARREVEYLDQARIFADGVEEVTDHAVSAGVA